ncbi:anti-sigma factor domain-containing protein [Amycolatopsis sp. cmx-4-68]|uniref:anti-sigma factor n=1 Tax=Amycolatopsis sp. cmx-4-68 TaxID=2790938 RepID=UPI0039790C57
MTAATTADVHSLTGAYALHALTSDEQAAFERHLAECGACADEVAELRATAARLGAAAALAPRAALRTQVLAAIATNRQERPLVGDPVVTPLRRRRFTRVTGAIASVAAAATLLVGGVALGNHVPPPPPTAQNAADTIVTEPDAVTYRATTPGARAAAVASHGRGKVVITAQGLPALDRSRIYQVWLIGPRGPQSAGLLPGEAGAPLVADLPPDSNRIAVTAEPAGGSPQPTTPGVVRIDLT